MAKRIDLSSSFYNQLNNRIIAVVSPTASGKTALAVELSKILNIEVISADSRQIYKYLNIGTAKPSKEELKQAKHHFIDIVTPDEYYSAGLFGNQAEKKISKILSKSYLPVVLGGTGLYIKALFDGLFLEKHQSIEKRSNLRNELQQKLNQSGIEYLYNELLKFDPISAQKYSDLNPRRIIRALEYYYLTGKPISLSHKTEVLVPKYQPIYYGIQNDRADLYNKINQRVELMWERGLVDEVKDILDMGYSENLNSLNTVGYKETIMFIKGLISEKRAIELIKQHTRNYAKRQMTWFRKLNVNWISGNINEIAENIAFVFINVVAKS